ncbi:hypothetical protein DBV15_11328 [Temnothorax longispinosus]|uniref:Caspase family p20 domain-containing protein n=1 Tax=Temnothorax longispinosus TaxID=300112 RepID=A0A4S2KW64_9HYME|nr:hypothetical protein DBV15_11328 [Temnothorax longispinosus]
MYNSSFDELLRKDNRKIFEKPMTKKSAEQIVEKLNTNMYGDPWEYLIPNNSLININLMSYDASYATTSIWNYFTAEKCPTLAGKPKLFFTGACQGMFQTEQYRALPNYNGIKKNYKTSGEHMMLDDMQLQKWFFDMESQPIENLFELRLFEKHLSIL